MLHPPPPGKEEGREPDEEVGTLSSYPEAAWLALIWDGGGCEEKWGGERGEGGRRELV